ncbi:zinc finger protein 671-like [Schistocerca nitens]|uniref:zinc finger protein 671-like n=1 Tax=Schistocerca nitens TaxID=7011 RepID=UPI0021196E35|nr:zinc finger protein 671-like [Schistocerca nitens]
MDSIFLCNRCGRSYSAKSSLVRHQKYGCDDIRRFICSLCGKKFKRCDTLSEHVKEDAVYLIKNSYKISKTPFVNLDTIYTLNSLHYVVYVSTFLCNRCGRSYSTKGSLVRHQKYDCGDIRQFVCSLCGKKFKRSHTLSEHVKGIGELEWHVKLCLLMKVPIQIRKKNENNELQINNQLNVNCSQNNKILGKIVCEVILAFIWKVLFENKLQNQKWAFIYSRKYTQRHILIEPWCLFSNAEDKNQQRKKESGNERKEVTQYSK